MVNYLEWTADGKCTQTPVEQTNVPGHLEIVQQVIFKFILTRHRLRL